MSQPEKKVNKVTAAVISILIERIEAGGVLPWTQPWTATGGGMNLDTMNFITKKPYNGINRWSTAALGFASPYFLTKKQAESLGGVLKDDEKKNYAPGVFWKKCSVRSTDSTTGDETETSFMRPVKYFRLYNVEQIEGLEIPETEAEEVEEVGTAAEGIEAAFDKFFAGYKNPPKVYHRGNKATYNKIKDVVTMPKKDSFKSLKDYLATKLHELCHSTGHPTRLNRSTLTDFASFGDENYSKEELVAELGAALCCSHLGIENCVEQTASYLKGWLDAIRADPNMLLSAASQAERAVAHIKGDTA
jgi:antirestriction protein ArdC